MRSLFTAARDLQVFFRQQGWEFCFIGGLAVWRWGKPRFTQDVDVTVLTGFRGEEQFVDTMMARYQSRIPEAREIFLAQRVLRLVDDAGVPIDMAMGGLPFEEHAVRRATDF